MTAKGFFGLQGVHDGLGAFNSAAFQIEQALRQMRTSIPVKIVAVYGGGTNGIPTVDVVPLINQVDGVGNRTPHGTIFNIPCVRNHGGGNAIINDPAVGDIGHMIVSDRDISAMKSTGGQASPGSRRIHSLADGVYHGAMVGGASQAVQFTDTGVKIFDKNGNIIEMANGAITITGNLRVTGSITAGYGGADAVNVQTHTHNSGAVPAPDPGS